MYFVILGRNTKICQKELEYANPQNIKKVSEDILLIEKLDEERLKDLAGVVKRGIMSDYLSLDQHLDGVKLVGATSKELGVQLKKEFEVKRFKIVDRINTDLEIKNEGVEVLEIGGQYGIVKGYQNISRFEKIDFEKPSRGMQVGMMPAKLTNTLINIGLGAAGDGKSKGGQDQTIRDPFCGFGTTLFLANSQGLYAIGSDINITEAKKNLLRRKDQDIATDKKIALFKHDIQDPIKLNLLKSVDAIITEGWLGPQIMHTTPRKVMMENLEKISNLYKSFLSTTFDYFDKITICSTFPIYRNMDNIVGQQIQEHAEKLGFEIEMLEEQYTRPNQRIARGIFIASK